MHFALVAHNVKYGDGQGRVNVEIVRRCLERGIDVTLVAHSVDPEVLDWGARWIRVPVRLERPILTKVVEFAWRADRIIDRIRNDIDILCANGVVCNRPHDVNIVHFVHTAWKDSTMHDAHTRSGWTAWYQRAFTNVNAWLEQRVLARSRQIIAVSERVANELHRLDLAVPIESIDNGVDVGEFHPAQDARPRAVAARRNRWSLPLDVPIGLFAGDLTSSRKNLDTVFKALVERPDWHLAVAGRTDRSPYPDMAKQMGIADRVHFTGFCDEMPALMRACDLFVFPSAYEPFALVVLEAMASGLPVITASTVGAAPLVSTNAGYVMQDPFDAVDLAHSLTAFSGSETRAQAGAAARQIAERNDWSRMADAYISTFRTLNCHVPRDYAAPSSPPYPFPVPHEAPRP